MLGYNAESQTRLAVSPNGSGTVSLLYARSATSASIYDGANGFAAYIRIIYEILNADAPITGKVQKHAADNFYSDITAYGDSAVTYNLSSGLVKYYQIPDNNTGHSDPLDIQFTTTAVTGATSSLGEILINTRTFAFPGWANANVTSGACLTNFEPGILNSPMGRQSAVTGYANELLMAKDEIFRRLKANGIDPNTVPTDGVGVIGTSGNNFPQNLATQLIPELCDAATWLALSIIHERYTTADNDYDNFRLMMYRARYEDAMKVAMQTLPLNLNKDWRLDSSESVKGAPVRLVM